MTSTKPEIGQGIYTAPDAARILDLPVYKVRRWLKEYWNKRFAGGDEGKSYSWGEGTERAFGFLTLMEFYVFYRLKEHGVRTSKILSAHERLSNRLGTKYPFASVKLLTGGGRILFSPEDGAIVEVEPDFQYNMKEVILPFCEKIEFDHNSLAQRYYPMGKKGGIVIDPQRQFGQPVVDGTNILPQTLWNYYLGGEKPATIAALFDIPLKAVKDAVAFCKKAA
jgi:uncharacterized protein (DUF433 family)